MWHFVQKGGIVMAPLLICSVLSLGVILERIWSFHRLLGIGRKNEEQNLSAEELENKWSRVVRDMSKGLTILETIVTVAPMLGLLGTVFGVINTFELLGHGPAGLGKNQLGLGLAEALITTAAGLVIAIPTLVALNAFRRKIDNFIDECNEHLTKEENKRHVETPSETKPGDRTDRIRGYSL